MGTRDAGNGIIMEGRHHGRDEADEKGEEGTQ